LGWLFLLLWGKMGTNYYARTNICKECNRYDEIHIGKSSMGWTFTFHATDRIKNYHDWKVFLLDKQAKIFDEYGEEITLEEFKKMIEAKRNSDHNHAIACKEEDSYLDNEGNSMSAHEFS